LFVEILDYYVYFYEIRNPTITDKFVSGLIALVNEHVDSMNLTVSTTIISEPKTYFVQILNLIKRKKKDELTKERFCSIIC